MGTEFHAYELQMLNYDEDDNKNNTSNTNTNNSNNNNTNTFLLITLLILLLLLVVLYVLPHCKDEIINDQDFQRNVTYNNLNFKLKLFRNKQKADQCMLYNVLVMNKNGGLQAADGAYCHTNWWWIWSLNLLVTCCRAAAGRSPAACDSDSWGTCVLTSQVPKLCVYVCVWIQTRGIR